MTPEQKNISRRAQEAFLKQIGEGLWSINDGVVTGGYVESGGFLVRYEPDHFWGFHHVRSMSIDGAEFPMTIKLMRAARRLIQRCLDEKSAAKQLENALKLDRALAERRAP